ncbi:MAG: mechanosensitive ion channel family protein [Gammaproteobacteria bacterium]
MTESMLAQTIATLPRAFIEPLFAAGAIVASVIVVRVVFALLGRSRKPFLQSAARRIARPVTLFVPVWVARLLVPQLPVGRAIREALDHGALLILIASVGWGLVTLFDAWRDFTLQRHPLQTANNLRARRLHTQIQIIRRTFIILVFLVCAAAMLMTFPAVRVIGATLFASAGVAGLILGFSARPVLSNLIAGIQIALTEPIRLDDVVIVEGEWGRIEEIRATYVVVRIWDLRRLVVPLSYFIGQPFQNWTRKTTNLLGTVYLYGDYTLPVEAIRIELHRLLQETPLWDRVSWGLQVTDATVQGIQLRALMSAQNSSDAWNLRCLVREQLIAFLQQHYPACLPHTRIDWVPDAHPERSQDEDSGS